MSEETLYVNGCLDTIKYAENPRKFNNVEIFRALRWAIRSEQEILDTGHEYIFEGIQSIDIEKLSYAIVVVTNYLKRQLNGAIGSDVFIIENCNCRTLEEYNTAIDVIEISNGIYDTELTGEEVSEVVQEVIHKANIVYKEADEKIAEIIESMSAVGLGD